MVFDEPRRVLKKRNSGRPRLKNIVKRVKYKYQSVTSKYQVGLSRDIGF